MKFKNILLAFIICSLFGGLIGSCTKSGSSGSTVTSGGGTGGTGSTIVTINISGMSFSPSSVTVKVGTIIKWTNSDSYSLHTATSDDGSTFNSGNIAFGDSYTPGGSYNYTTTKAGTYPYHCNIHAGMKGTLIVTN